MSVKMNTIRWYQTELEIKNDLRYSNPYQQGRN